MYKSHHSKQQTSTKQLTKQVSSPLLNQHNKHNPTASNSNIYDGLVYSRRRDFDYMNSKKQDAFKKSGIRQPIAIGKTKKQPIFVKHKPTLPQTQKHLQSLTIFSKIMGKSKIQPWQKQKKHFSYDYNPEICRLQYQDTKNATSKQDLHCSATRYRKIVQDFDDRIGFGSTGMMPGVSETQTSGKRHSYKLNMFKQSRELGIQDYKNHTRKPYILRNHSLIHLG